MIASILAVTTGCGGGGGGTPPPAQWPVDGNVLKGMVGGATVKFYALTDKGARGALLGTATTASAGTFSATLSPPPSAPFLAESAGGAYVDEATAATVTLGASDVLTAVVPAGSHWVSITAWTHVAAARALALAAGGTPLATAVAAANAQVAQQLGLGDLVATKAVAATDANGLATASLAQRVEALVVAGLAQEAATLGVRAIDLAAALALDQADGLLDGLQGSTPIQVPLIAGGTVALPSAASTTGLQAAIDAFAATAANKTNLATATVAPTAAPVGPSAGGFYVTSTALPAWTSGQAGSFKLTATGGTLPYHCTLASGTLPAWLSLASDCTLSGTAPALAGGTTRSVSAPFTVTVADAASGAQAVTLSVTVVQPKPTLVLASPLPRGTVGLPYSAATVSSVSGGSPPYHYMSDSFAAGTPPPGTSVNLTTGRLAGTPGAPGTYGFGICAVDLVGSTTCASTSVTVDPLPPGGVAMTFTGTFSGAGDFQRTFPATTCSFHNAFSGTVTVAVVAKSGGAYTGTATVDGHWVSTATGGSTSTFTCLNTDTTWSNVITLSDTMPAISWPDVWTTPGGSTVTGAFTGTITQSAVTGTQVETLNTSTGSASLAISLPRQ